MNRQSVEFNLEKDKIKNELLSMTIDDILEARLAIEEENYQKAVNILSHLLENKQQFIPSDEPYLWLAESYENIGKIDRAAALYIFLLQTRPEVPTTELALRRLIGKYYQ